MKLVILYAVGFATTGILTTFLIVESTNIGAPAWLAIGLAFALAASIGVCLRVAEWLLMRGKDGRFRT